MRNRTLAARNIGFVPVPLAKRFRQAHSTKKSHGGAPSKHSNSSRIRAQVMRNSTLAARNIGFVPVPLAKRVPLAKAVPTGPQHEEVPWRSAFETLEQQQDSCSSHAKQQDSCSSRARQVPHRSTTIFCNNFLGALPLTARKNA